MRHKLLIISVLFIILGCSKDDYDPTDDQNYFCECTEVITVKNIVQNQILSTQVRDYNGACNESGNEITYSQDNTIQTTKRTNCRKP